MASIFVKDAAAALTGNGDALGWVTVASVADFYPGAVGALYSAGAGSLAIKIAAVDATNNKIRVRPIPGSGAATYGYADVTAYTTAGSAIICQEAGVVPLQAPSTIVKKDRAV